MTTPTETPTPRTDELYENHIARLNSTAGWNYMLAHGAMFDFARTLERQLTAATAQLEERDLAIKGLQEDIALMQSNQDRFMEVETARLQHSVKCRELTAQLEEARSVIAQLVPYAERELKANDVALKDTDADSQFYGGDIKTQPLITRALAAMQQKEGK